MQNDKVKEYYELLKTKRNSLFIKRLFDLIFSFVLSIVFLPIIILVSIIIKLDSPGKIFFIQNRVTKDGKIFKIFKFRTMVENAAEIGAGVTTDNDVRITRCGKYLRKFRIDEIPQIFNILKGDMSFVGVRPESVKYVEKYTPEMYATLLLPAGVTSITSIIYKDESELLKNSENPDETYINEILPKKMEYNLKYIKEFNFWYDIKIIFKTIIAVIKK